MPISPLRLIKNSVEYYHKTRWDEIPRFVRGIYVLYKFNSRTGPSGSYGVVYVGMSGSEGGRVRGRIKSHFLNKGDQWSHFSVYEVFENIREEEVKELEGLFRHIYRRDARANKLNKQRGVRKLGQVRSRTFEDWE